MGVGWRDMELVMDGAEERDPETVMEAEGVLLGKTKGVARTERILV